MRGLVEGACARPPRKRSRDIFASCPIAGLLGFGGLIWATAASADMSAQPIAVLQGLDIVHYFNAVISGLDVARVKPAPDIFLAAARAVGAIPSECLVLEDAEKGVLAAHEAGMVCIAVPNEHTRHHDFSRAMRICASLNEITLELIEQLMPPRS